jgi:hypothetical protein
LLKIIQATMGQITQVSGHALEEVPAYGPISTARTGPARETAIPRISNSLFIATGAISDSGSWEPSSHFRETTAILGRDRYEIDTEFEEASAFRNFRFGGVVTMA